MMMATLADGFFFIMKKLRQSVLFDVLCQYENNFLVGQLNRFIFIHHHVDNNRFWYIIDRGYIGRFSRCQQGGGC